LPCVQHTTCLSLWTRPPCSPVLTVLTVVPLPCKYVCDPLCPSPFHSHTPYCRWLYVKFCGCYCLKSTGKGTIAVVTKTHTDGGEWCHEFCCARKCREKCRCCDECFQVTHAIVLALPRQQLSHGAGVRCGALGREEGRVWKHTCLWRGRGGFIASVWVVVGPTHALPRRGIPPLPSTHTHTHTHTTASRSCGVWRVWRVWRGCLDTLQCANPPDYPSRFKLVIEAEMGSM